MQKLSEWVKFHRYVRKAQQVYATRHRIPRPRSRIHMLASRMLGLGSWILLVQGSWSLYLDNFDELCRWRILQLVAGSWTYSLRNFGKLWNKHPTLNDKQGLYDWTPNSVARHCSSAEEHFVGHCWSLSKVDNKGNNEQHKNNYHDDDMPLSWMEVVRHGQRWKQLEDSFVHAARLMSWIVPYPVFAWGSVFRLGLHCQSSIKCYVFCRAPRVANTSPATLGWCSTRFTGHLGDIRFCLAADFVFLADEPTEPIMMYRYSLMQQVGCHGALSHSLADPSCFAYECWQRC